MTEKSADEMFKELGYEKEKIELFKIIKYNKDSENKIYFDLEENRFYKTEDISMQELQAIIQKCKELGWL